MARKAKLRYSPPIKPSPKKKRGKSRGHTPCYTDGWYRVLKEFYDLVHSSNKGGGFGLGGLTASLVLKAPHHGSSAAFHLKCVVEGEAREVAELGDKGSPAQAIEFQRWLPRFCRGYFECARSDLLAERAEARLRDGQPLSGRMVTTREETWIALQALWAGFMGMAGGIVPTLLRRFSSK